MKLIKNSSIVMLCLFVILNLSSQTKNKTPFIPMKLGNYWVYSNSSFPNNLDTIKITDKKVFGTDTAYGFKGTFMMEKNDTIYRFQSSWGSGLFPVIQYFPTKKK